LQRLGVFINMVLGGMIIALILFLLTAYSTPLKSNQREVLA